MTCNYYTRPYTDKFSHSLICVQNLGCSTWSTVFPIPVTDTHLCTHLLHPIHLLLNLVYHFLEGVHILVDLVDLSHILIYLENHHAAPTHMELRHTLTVIIKGFS